MKVQLDPGSFILLVVLILLLLASVWYAAQGFLLPGDPGPTQGYAATFLGVFMSFAVGSILMALVFFNGRSGYDAVSGIKAQQDLKLVQREGWIAPSSRDEQQ